MSSSFGHSFRITTFGESHGKSLGVVIDGCPSQVPIDMQKIQQQLNRRRPGTSEITSERKEKDKLICLSGLENHITLGSPIALQVLNKDAKPSEYSSSQNLFRPSHADYSYKQKFHILPSSGGGRASARETVARVAAGSVAEQMLQHMLPSFRITAYTSRVGDIAMPTPYHESVELTRSLVDTSPVRCPEPISAEKMTTYIQQVKSNLDSTGGEICCVIQGVPAGLGEPVFDKLEADLAKAMLSIPACRYFVIGDGIAASKRLGSQNNDALGKRAGHIKRASNHAGGIEGGISNGEILYFFVGFKPPSTIFQPQSTLSQDLKPTTFTPQTGRHDPCVLPRAVPIIEGMASLVIADHYLRHISLDKS